MKKPITIMIVEDEAITSIYLKMQLEKKGYTINKVLSSAEEAIAKIEFGKDDLILMDINLSGKLNGIEAMECINNATYIPVIFLTGYPDENLKKRANKLNPAGYFIKPVNIEKLDQAINSVFN